MKKECIDYAENLNKVGDLIISISDLLKPVEVVAEEFSPEDFKVYEKDLSDVIDRYEYAKDSLASIKVPSFLGDQHKQLVDRFGNFIESIRIMKNSIQLTSDNQPEIDKEKYMRGYTEQFNSVASIGDVTQRIGDILIKEC